MIKLNKITASTSLLLPNLERQFLGVNNSHFFIALDILNGFDFLPTLERYQEIFTLVSRRAAWNMLGAPMGWRNTPALFCERIVTDIINGEDEKFFAKPNNGCIAWLDDLLLYVESFKSLLHIHESLLKQAAKMKVRFNLRKLGLCEPITIWCGREIKHGRWNFDPSFNDKILNLPKPSYQHELAQLVYLCNWISPNVPKIAALRKPFVEFANLKGKKLSDLERVRIEIEWTEDLEKVYQDLLEVMFESSQRHLSTYEPKDPILLFTDSSSDTWSLAVFQDKQPNITNDVRRLQPRPLIFLSGSFTTSEVRWYIVSKELYPIIYPF
eukprot:snap_masked-scaffold_39-processed-gene-2.51-mRNA-1 protein AED:1.00 eAED:1.00 QI:0/-1/0/0/-1/1/1/0/325